MDFDLTSEQRLLQETVRAFVDDRDPAGRGARTTSTTGSTST